MKILRDKSVLWMLQAEVFTLIHTDALEPGGEVDANNREMGRWYTMVVSHEDHTIAFK